MLSPETTLIIGREMTETLIRLATLFLLPPRVLLLSRMPFPIPIVTSLAPPPLRGMATGDLVDALLPSDLPPPVLVVALLTLVPIGTLTDVPPPIGPIVGTTLGDPTLIIPLGLVCLSLGTLTPGNPISPMDPPPLRPPLLALSRSPLHLLRCVALVVPTPSL